MYKKISFMVAAALIMNLLGIVTTAKAQFHAAFRVPNVIGMSEDDAINAIYASFFYVSCTEEYSATVPEGHVISQAPLGGTWLEEGSVVYLTISKSNGQRDLVHFNDPRLKAAVEDELGVTDPTAADMLNLTSLDAYDEDIIDLTGLEYAINLLHLGLQENQIGDISPLAGLTNLTALYLSRNQISDISPVAGLTNLDYLHLADNQISDISPVAGLTNLDYLHLANNQISDISPVAGLTNLDYLHLGHNQISDISPLAGLMNLERLYLYENQISDISPVAGLTNLDHLLLAYNQISDLSPLAGLTNLSDLVLQCNPLNLSAYTVYIPQMQANGIYVHYICSETDIILTLPAISVGSTSATLIAQVFDTGEVWAVKFAYRTYPGGQPVETSSVGGKTDGDFVAMTVYNLLPNTNYEFWAIATNAGGTHEGAKLIFKTLSGGSQPPETVRVPDVVGMNQTDAESAITSAGLEVSHTYENSNTIPEGYVISQTPSGGTWVDEGSTVTLTISTGSSMEVPETIPWDRAAYWDPRYPSAWVRANSVRDGLDSAGYKILDADELKTWMDARIADREPSVVVFCQDIAPETVFEAASSTCTLRRYLNTGGKIVWYGDIPLYYQGYSDGTSTQFDVDGSIGALGFNAAGGEWGNDVEVTLTDTGIAWGLTQTWISTRPASNGTLRILASARGQAAAWVKHYLPGDTYRGFVRFSDCGVEPDFEDIRRLAEYPNVDSAGPVNLIAHWRLDEKRGRTAYDLVGMHHGTLQGNPVWQPVDGMIDGALRFDGIGDYVEIADHPDFDLTERITIAAWIRVDAFDKYCQAIITKGDSAWRIQRNANTNTIEFACDSPAGGGVSQLRTVQGNIPVNDGQWHHVAGTYDGAKICLYVDGLLDKSISAQEPIATNDFWICIGENNQIQGRYWKGMIDDVRIYDEALTETQIVSVMTGLDTFAPVEGRDIGTYITGSNSYADGVYTIEADGADIWGNYDEFHYVYMPVTGDFELSARVLSLENTNSWAKAGVMVRETLSPESRHAFMCVTPEDGEGLFAFQCRSETSGLSVSLHSVQGQVAYPTNTWVKINRQGNSFTGMISLDGVVWQNFPGPYATEVWSSNPVTINMPGTVYIGLAVTSHSDGQLCTAEFDSVSFLANVGLTQSNITTTEEP